MGARVETVFVDGPQPDEIREQRANDYRDYLNNCSDLLVATHDSDEETFADAVTSLRDQMLAIKDDHTANEILGSGPSLTINAMSLVWTGLADGQRTESAMEAIHDHMAHAWNQAWEQVLEAQKEDPMPSLFFGTRRNF